jgi:hypothetical protein
MAETPEQKYNRIAAAVQQTILQNFPNPDRVGCPGETKLREVAARKTIVEDDSWEHITHCSPCYREFLAEKERLRGSQRKTRTRAALAAAALLVILSGLTAYFLRPKPQSEVAQVRPEPATLDLKDTSGVRGDAKALERAVPVLPRRKLELTVVLPFGSEAGIYQFRLVDPEGRVVNSGEATATIASGTTTMRMTVDTSALHEGDYRFAIRQQALDWIIYPVRLR